MKRLALASVGLVLATARCGNDGGARDATGGATPPTIAGAAGGGAAGEKARGEGGAGGVMSPLGGAGTVSAGAPGAGGEPPCVSALATLQHAPDVLSEAGLYDDIVDRRISPLMRPFEPQFELWSDGADKTRWIYLPECGVIDTSDMDQWSFPVGTRVFKEFVVDEKRVETRLIHRHGPGPDDFLFATYVWNDSETEAVLDRDGEPNARNTGFNVPTEAECGHCHGGGLIGGLPSRILGFSAIQLSHDGASDILAELSQNGHLSTPPPEEAFTVPGSPTERAALGYLHANCGFCHNESVDGVTTVDMRLRLQTIETELPKTGAYVTAVNQPVTLFTGQGCTHRIAGQDAPNSCIHQRMSSRTPGDQMPPIDTSLVDPKGLATIEAWIETLPPPP